MSIATFQSANMSGLSTRVTMTADTVSGTQEGFERIPLVGSVSPLNFRGFAIAQMTGPTTGPSGSFQFAMDRGGGGSLGQDFFRTMKCLNGPGTDWDGLIRHTVNATFIGVSGNSSLWSWSAGAQAVPPITNGGVYTFLLIV